MSDFAPASREIGSLLLGGGVFLVIGAVALSLMESSYSGSAASHDENRDLETLIQRGQSQLSEVNAEIRIERRKLERWETQLAVARESQQLDEKLAQASRDHADQVAAVSSTEEKIEALEAEWVSYRGRMRDSLWPKFTSQKLKEEDLLTPSGFKNATITGVDAAGLMIRHQSGVARIPVARLAPGFRDKLDLHLEEATEMMSKLNSRDAKFKREQDSRMKKDSEPSEGDAVAKRAKALDDGQEKVASLYKLIASSDAEAANARYQDRHSSNRSAPGSLETWAQRANRFEVLALKYRNQLAATVLMMQKLDPL